MAPVARATSSKISLKVWIETPRTPVASPAASASSLSKRATSSAVGTISTGSSSSEASRASWILPARPEFGGPTINESGIRSQHRSRHGARS